MPPIEIGIIGIIVMLILIFARMPVGLAMGLVGFLGFVSIVNLEAGIAMLGKVAYVTVANFDYSVVPLFVLMGELCFGTGVSQDLYNAVYRWLGHMRGGLAVATVTGCAGFAAVSGSSLATAATMGAVSLPEMRRYKYDDGLSTGSIAAGGTIGSLIPPSVILIIYGMLTQVSVGKLFLAGFIPGILEALFYISTIYIVCTKSPIKGPPGPRFSLKEKLIALRKTWTVISLFFVVIGGIYLGVFSPTEAGGVGAFGAFFFGLIRKKITLRGFVDSLVNTGRTTAMIFVIVIGAMIFGYFLAVTRLPYIMADSIANVDANRYVILAVILVTYLLLGCVMDSLAMVLLTVPIFFPLVMSLGFDAIWFGIIVVRIVEIGLITPPIGMNVFVIKAVAGDVPIQKIFEGIVPFLVADIFHITLLLSIPSITLFLPSLMK